MAVHYALWVFETAANPEVHSFRIGLIQNDFPAIDHVGHILVGNKVGIFPYGPKKFMEPKW